MLLVSRDEGFEQELNYDDGTGKADDIPTIIIKKSDGDEIADYMQSNTAQAHLVTMLIKFEAVKIIYYYR